ncbi:hypothetical protein [Fusobacterium polymorphum]|uniref:hypothetical protein n=1 Tax=Fusobacterium nucleatum subsp. polymorphum TaxID=76857 RepID=UPI0030D58370
MIRYVVLLAKGLADLFEQDIEDCIKNFNIKIKPINSEKMRKNIEKFENKTGLFFNDKNERAMIVNDSGDFKIFYDKNKLEKDTAEWYFALAHELAHFLFWHIHSQSESVFEPYLLPKPLGISPEIVMIHKDIVIPLIYWEYHNNYVPSEYDNETIADIFAIIFLCTFMAKPSYIRFKASHNMLSDKKYDFFPSIVARNNALYLEKTELKNFLNENKIFNEIISNNFRFPIKLKPSQHNNLKDIILWNVGRAERDINEKRLFFLMRFVGLDSIKNALNELVDKGEIIVYQKGNSNYVTMPHEKKELFCKDHNIIEAEIQSLNGVINKITG